MNVKDPALSVIRTSEGRQFVMQILRDLLYEKYVFGPSDSCNMTAARLERLQLARQIRGLCEETDEGLELMLLAEQEHRRYIAEEAEKWELNEKT